ncbi:MAG TPA: ROK family protein [Candidatus Limnocylindrales bacterium]|nr:ROK family protein [Candidatus Limnocylindrales bacterium]
MATDSDAIPGSEPAATHHLGLDLGGTNLKWTVVEHAGADWRVLDRGQVPTRSGGPDAIVPQLAEVGRAAIGQWPDVSTAGVGIPGLYDPRTGATRFLVNIPGPWDGYPVAGPLADELGVPVALINDARAFGLAELRLGAGRGASSMVGLTLGTGVGGVIAVDGKVHQGHDGTAGEVGHQTIDPDGPSCNCGNHGCLEAFCRADRIAEACGAATAEEAVERARSGDAAALEGLRRVGRYLGIGIGNMITVISPDRVVIGGGIAAAGDLLLDEARAEIRRRVLTTSVDEVEIVTAELGTWAGAMGAAIHGAEQAPPQGTADASPGSAAVIAAIDAAVDPASVVR